MRLTVTMALAWFLSGDRGAGRYRDLREQEQREGVADADPLEAGQAGAHRTLVVATACA